MAENRLSREIESRESAQRKKAWTPPQLLPMPNPRDGWVHRWIRTSTMGTADSMNVSANFRQGWEPCKAEDYPELMHLADPNSRYKGNIENGGLLLCKVPREMMEQRDAYYRNQNTQQMVAVDNNFMRENDARMPLFSEKKSGVTFGKGS
jgi:hypothetical protein